MLVRKFCKTPNLNHPSSAKNKKTTITIENDFLIYNSLSNNIDILSVPTIYIFETTIVTKLQQKKSCNIITQKIYTSRNLKSIQSNKRLNSS